MAGRVRIGTQGWNYAAWVGSFYPEGTRPAEMLTLFAQAFATVEVDSTFYATPPVNSVRGWASRTPEGFVFALKLPREITHDRHLRRAEDETELFIERARLLGPKLGPILVQLGPDFAPGELGALRDYLPLLPRDLRFAVEVRQERWVRPNVLPDLLELLRDHGVALALSDGQWLPREAVLDLAAAPTADFAYVRWMGPNRDLTDFSRIQTPREREVGEWIGALGRLSELGIDVYGYVNNHFEGHSPATAREIQSLLGQRPVDPRDLGEQISLF
ncbi:MAG TPA: DUF72 domain-containing protein [Longimicrobiaceae bacterium]|nr:DUF72 domain-containing protein [Longimicrobiaceae bacterium]